MTYANLLYEIKNFTQIDLPEQLTNELNAVVKQVNAELGEMGTDIIKNEAAMKKAYADFVIQIGKNNDAFTAEIERRVMLINNRVGPEGVVRKTLTADSVLTIDPVWPTAHPIMFAYTQDANGNRTVTPGAGIVGELVLDPEPGSTTVFELLPDGKGSWTVVQKLEESLLRVEDYYRRADGNDWYPAIMRAQTAAGNGAKTIALTAGKVYNISKTLLFSGQNVSMASFGAVPAVIQAARQAYNAMTIDTPTNTHQRFLASNMQINNHGWIINDATGIVPGMLVNVISSAPWYFDPRSESSDARKSELHRVMRVEGTRVFMEDPSNDGYDIAKETVELNFWNPITVNLDNITIRGELPEYSATPPNARGLTIIGAYEPKLNNVNIERMTYLGMLIRSCYRPNIIGGHTYEANYSATGYGVQLQGCARAFVFNRSFWGCRRGVDVSAGNIISRRTVIDSCINLGGGRQSDGTYWGWDPNGGVGVQNFGFGSHGGADQTTYRNCQTANVHIPYGLRGGNEVIENAIHYGRTRNGFIALTSGSNLTVRGCKVYSEGVYAFKNGSIYDGGANANSRRADYFIYIRPDYDFLRSRIMVQNIDAEVQKAFIYMLDGTVPQWFMHLSNIRVNFAPQGTTEECALLWHESATLGRSNYRWTIGPIDMQRETGSGTRLTKNINMSGVKLLEYGVSGTTD